VYVGLRRDIPVPREKGEEVVSASVRRFEFVGGSSYKFWEVQVQGKDVVIRFGRIGTSGQTQTKNFPDAAAAAKHADRLIREKTGKGYQEVGSSRVA
jgi:predicted DNA-binding WGR domain protein